MQRCSASFCVINVYSAGISPTQTLAHVQSICTVLSNMGKQVWICTVPNWRDRDVLTPVAARDNIERNELLKEYLKT